MTAKTPTQLLTVFENGDIPVQADYQDLFDSYVNIVQTTAQSMASALTLPTLTVTTLNVTTFSPSTINATTGNITTVSANTINAANANITTVSAATANITTVSAATANITTVSADTINVNIVSAQSIITSALNTGVLSRSVDITKRATGTTQATAVTLTAELNRIVNASAGGNGAILTATVGREQIVFNDAGFSIDVYPVVGASINSQAVNTPLSVGVSTEISFYYVGNNLFLSK